MKQMMYGYGNYVGQQQGIIQVRNPNTTLSTKPSRRNYLLSAYAIPYQKEYS